MGVLPEIEYGAPVQTSSDDLARVGQAARRTFGVLEQGFTKYGQAMVKNEVEGASLALRTGLADLEQQLAEKRYVSTQDLRDMLGPDFDSIDPKIRKRLQQPNPLTGELEDRGQIPVWQVAGLIQKTRAKQLLKDAANRITVQGWRSDFEAAAEGEVAQSRIRVAKSQAAAMDADLQAEEEAQVAQMIRLKDWDGAIGKIDRSSLFGPGKKAALAEQVLKAKQTSVDTDTAVGIANAAFTAGVVPGTRVIHEGKIWDAMKGEAGKVGASAEVTEDARKLLRQRINDFDEQRKSLTSQVFAEALQAFQAPGADGKPRLTTAVIPEAVRNYLTDPANGPEAANLWNSLLDKERAEQGRDRQLANTPSEANWAAYGALVKDMNDNPSKYRGMDGARFTAEVYGKVGPLIGQAMTAYKAATEQTEDKRVLGAGERRSVLEALPPKFRPSTTTKPGSLEGQVWSLIQQRIGDRKAAEWDNQKGPVPPAILQKWVAEEWAAGTVPGGRLWGILDRSGVPKIVADVQGQTWVPDQAPPAPAKGPALQGKLTRQGGPPLPPARPRRTVNGETRVWDGTAWVKE